MKSLTLLIIPLLVISPTLAYATNESSYKYGYGQGKSEWTDCTNFDADCSDGLSDCQSPVTTYAKNSTSGYYDIRTDHYDIVTNTTACIDGYVHAWNHVCNQKQARVWSNDGVPCPTTFKREAINDTLPAKVPPGAIAVLSTIDKRAANESDICGTKGITELISCGESATQQAIEGNNTLPIIHIPALPSLDEPTALPGHGPIWNIVNESKTGQKTSGTIIFTWEPIGGKWYHQGKHKFFSGSISHVFIEHINGKNKILKGLWGYDYLPPGLYLCKANGEFTKDSPCFLKFTKIEPNHSELVDKRGDIIYLMRGGSGADGNQQHQQRQHGGSEIR
jgi:hypothetical protein